MIQKENNWQTIFFVNMLGTLFKSTIDLLLIHLPCPFAFYGRRRQSALGLTMSFSPHPTSARALFPFGWVGFLWFYLCQFSQTKKFSTRLKAGSKTSHTLKQCLRISLLIITKCKSWQPLNLYYTHQLIFNLRLELHMTQAQFVQTIDHRFLDF